MSLLKSQFCVKNLTLKNRLVLPPMATGKADEAGRTTEELLAFYEQKARGGHIGLVILEHSYVNPKGRAREGQLSLAKDGDEEELAKLAAVFHRSGCMAAAQINHGGSVSVVEPVGPSAVKSPRAKNDVIPREMSREEIEQLKEDFAAAALRAKKAGFDAVEIHVAHGYLLNQFYSPLTNCRTDVYGGSVENRIRLGCETVAAVRRSVGEDFPIIVRLGGCDYLDGGNTEEDAVTAAALLEQAGADVLDLSGGMCGYVRAGHEEAGYFASMAEKIKEKVHIPLILTGGVKTGAAAEELLQRGCADLIGVGRAILADSGWAERELKRI